MQNFRLLGHVYGLTVLCKDKFKGRKSKIDMPDSKNFRTLQFLKTIGTIDLGGQHVKSLIKHLNDRNYLGYYQRLRKKNPGNLPVT